MTNGSYENNHTITAADGTTVPVPDEYVCPLTLDVMAQPYLSREGHNYERDAIMTWVSNYGSSPLTREKLMPVHLSRNKALEMKIRLFLLQHGVASVGKTNNNVDKWQCPMQGGMTLRELAATTSVQVGSEPPALTEVTPVSEDQLAERRQQIADLIGSAMSELDEF